MTATTGLLLLSAFLQALGLWVLTDLRDRVRRLEDEHFTPRRTVNA